MQRNVASALVAALLVVVVAVSACGSGSKPLSAAELRTQASAVCRDVRAQFTAIQARSTQTTLQTRLSRAADAMSDGIDRLEALTPPEQLADRYAQFLTWKRAQRDAAHELAQPGGRLSARSRRAVEAHHSPLEALSHELGISGC